MFEMKNEGDDHTATKKKNEEFFAKLDKDRKRQRLRICSTGFVVRGRQRAVQHRYYRCVSQIPERCM